MRYNVTDLMQHLHQEHEKIISTVITWQMKPEKQLLSAPGAGSWSASQCLEHLNSYGRYYLPEIEKAISNSSSLSRIDFKSGWLGNYFYQLMLTDSTGKIKKKMKSPAPHAPSPDLKPYEVITEFLNQQEKLSQLLTAAEKTDLNRARVPISVLPVIKLKLGDTILFYTAHLLRHIAQATRALNHQETKEQVMAA